MSSSFATVHYRDVCDYVRPDFPAIAVSTLNLHFPRVIIPLIEDYCRLRITFTRVNDDEVEISPAILIPMADKKIKWRDGRPIVVYDESPARCLMCDSKGVDHSCARSIDVSLNCAVGYFSKEHIVIVGWRRGDAPVINDNTASLIRPTALIARRLIRCTVAGADHVYKLDWESASACPVTEEQRVFSDVRLLPE